jgi:hypothetical protein
VSECAECVLGVDEVVAVDVTEDDLIGHTSGALRIRCIGDDRSEERDGDERKGCSASG